MAMNAGYETATCVIKHVTQQTATARKDAAGAAQSLKELK